MLTLAVVPRLRRAKLRATRPVPRSLTMTCRAARSRVDVVLGGKLVAVELGIFGSLPSHAGDLIFGAKLGVRVAVAVETELHGQRLSLGDLGHLVDPAVAHLAAHPFGDV